LPLAANDILDICNLESVRSGDAHHLCDMTSGLLRYSDKNTIEGFDNTTFFTDPIFVIKVLAYNRPPSLSRLLDSLLKANYNHVQVNIEIIIDGPRLNESDKVDCRFDT